jgi:hypothetical protein
MMPPEAQGLEPSELAAWVTRDAMIGTGVACSPASRPTGTAP